MNTFDLITKFNMTNKPITEEQYNTLNEIRPIFELLNQKVLDIPNPGPTWLLKMQRIYSNIFNAPLPNIGCRSCILNSLQMLWPKIKEYETINNQTITNVPSSPSDKPEHPTPNPNGATKNRGKQPKSWE